jgi:transposase InsO family protein
VDQALGHLGTRRQHHDCRPGADRRRLDQSGVRPRRDWRRGLIGAEIGYLLQDARVPDVILDFSRRGKPTDNDTIESFNGRFREQCLNVHWFDSIDDAQQKIDAFRWDYNERRPHRSLKGLSPREFAERTLKTAAGSLC